MKYTNERAEVVKTVFHMLVDQHMSIGAIARYLTRAQIPTRNDIGRSRTLSCLGNVEKSGVYRTRRLSQDESG